MNVITYKVKGLDRRNRLTCLLRVAGPEWKAEFRVDCAGLDLVVSMYVDSGVQPQKHPYSGTELFGDLGQLLNLEIVIDGDQADPGGDRCFEFACAFVVAMKRHFGCRNAGQQ